MDIVAKRQFLKTCQNLPSLSSVFSDAPTTWKVESIRVAAAQEFHPWQMAARHRNGCGCPPGQPKSR